MLHSRPKSGDPQTNMQEKKQLGAAVLHLDVFRDGKCGYARYIAASVAPRTDCVDNNLVGVGVLQGDKPRSNWGLVEGNHE